MTRVRALPGHRVPSLDELSTLRSPLTLSDIKLLVIEGDFSLFKESGFKFSSHFQKHYENVRSIMVLQWCAWGQKKNTNLRKFDGMNFAWFQKGFNMTQADSA